MTLGIIPARYASTRFPGKPLAIIHGKTMIQRVYEQASKAELLDKVIVATDDERIANHVIAFGGVVIMTNTNHLNGTSRCAEVIALLDETIGYVINIQGDEPYIQPQQIDLVAQGLIVSEPNIVTLRKKIESYQDLLSPNVVKVVTNQSGNALYFSRNVIPYLQNEIDEASFSNHTFYKHIGIYGYPVEVLRQIIHLPIAPLEQMEQLEQLRWLYHGYNINTNITAHDCHAVDTPQDIDKLSKHIEA